MEASGGVALPSESLDEAFTALRITGNSAATSSSNHLWHHTTNQGSGKIDTFASLLSWTDGQQAVGHSGRTGKRPRVSERPVSSSTRRTVRRVGSAAICFGAVSALHRKDEEKKRGAKTLAQVVSDKGKNTSPAGETYGSTAELTAKTAAQGLSAGGHEAAKKTSDGKQSTTNGKVTTAAEIGGSADFDLQKPQKKHVEGVSTISTAGSRQGEIHEHADGTASGPSQDDDGISAQEYDHRGESEDSGKPRNHVGARGSAGTDNSEAASTDHANAASSKPAPKKGVSAQKYPQRAGSEDKKTRIEVEDQDRDTTKSVKQGTDTRLRKKGNKGQKSAKAAAPTSESLDASARPTYAGAGAQAAAAGRPQRDSISTAATIGDTETSAGGTTSVGELDVAASMAEFEGGEDLGIDGAGIATDTYTTTAGKLKLLRKSSEPPPSLFGKLKQVCTEVADGFIDVLRRRIEGLLGSSSSALVGGAEMGRPDMDRMRDEGEQALSLLQRNDLFSDPTVVSAMKEVNCQLKEDPSDGLWLIDRDEQLLTKEHA
ncbi:unnamed protein product [Amoebophrya sp. A25]|nr:unnamed protein product [Amoebophrya sp. A25]|eukprot:GSA25T00010755001.1